LPLADHASRCRTSLSNHFTHAPKIRRATSLADAQTPSDDSAGPSPPDLLYAKQRDSFDLARLQMREEEGAHGVIRRARSASLMDGGPYPQRSHSCPIPNCGRLFKRLEHLKR
jgi:transcription factor STE12